MKEVRDSHLSCISLSWLLNIPCISRPSSRRIIKSAQDRADDSTNRNTPQGRKAKRSEELRDIYNERVSYLRLRQENRSAAGPDIPQPANDGMGKAGHRRGRGDAIIWIARAYSLRYFIRDTADDSDAQSVSHKSKCLTG